ncbi:DUF2752 domain-containing protein [Candidatus Woesearchaeota archaeon]|nr:DUF2752 domain-containing protein [Candidatus Woesearchaeota archaeon]
MSVILFALAVLPTEFVLLSPSRCIFRQYILPLIFQNQCPSAGIFSDCLCPACGITRATSRLLHGDLDGALAYNWLAIPVVIGMIALAVINIFRLRKH